MRRLLLALLIGGIAASIVFAFAASLDVTSDDLGAGDSDVVSCDTEVTVSYAVEYDEAAPGFIVPEVTVGDIDAGCIGQDITVVLTEGGADIGGNDTPIAVTGDTVTVALTDPPLAEIVDDVHAVITGPPSP